MALISINNLSFSYDGSYDTVFENVNLQLDTNWKLGFVGRNGRGKTTFLKLLLNEYSYKGQIISPVFFDYFPFLVPNRTDLTDQVVNEIYPDLQRWELFREFAKLEMDRNILYRPFETLSLGEQTKTLLAVLFLKQNRFLLIDEPTNHLDTASRTLVGDYLNSKNGFILVSHDREVLDHCADHILVINKTNIEVLRGNFSSWYHNKQLQDNFELAQNKSLKKEIGHLTEAARRTARWSDKVEQTKYGSDNSGLSVDRGYVGHKSAKMMKRAKVLESRQQNAIAEKSALLKNVEGTETLKLAELKFHTKRLLALAEISIRYSETPVCEPVSFTVEQGDRVALRGRNGCGKTSLLKLILGENIPYTGRLYKNHQLVISYISQDTSSLSGSLSTFARNSGIDETQLKTILRKLDFSRIQFDMDISDFSAGQKKKVLIAASLCRQAHLLVWDEPLNYIDVFSRIQIEDLLLSYEPTMIFVEHDGAFCEKIATKSVDLQSTGI